MRRSSCVRYALREERASPSGSRTVGTPTLSTAVPVGMVAKQGLGARGDVFEADLPRMPDEVLGHAAIWAKTSPGLG